MTPNDDEKDAGSKSGQAPPAGGDKPPATSWSDTLSKVKKALDDERSAPPPTDRLGAGEQVISDDHLSDPPRVLAGRGAPSAARASGRSAISEVPKLARTPAEAHLYMDRHPCSCGEAAFPRRNALAYAGDLMISVYDGTCPSCGAPREFRFRVPEDLPRPGDSPLGGDAISELFDPGEFMAIADEQARGVPSSATGLSPSQRAAAHRRLALACAAIEEILKFVPEGAEAVPRGAIRVALGRAVFDGEPGRFRKNRLQAVLQSYRAMRDGFAD